MAGDGGKGVRGEEVRAKKVAEIGTGSPGGSETDV